MLSPSLSEEEEEEIQLSDSDDYTTTIDQNLVNMMVQDVKNRDKVIPEFSDFAKQNSSLLATAKKIHQIFSVPDFVTYSYETRQDLELIIRSFIADVIDTANQPNNEGEDNNSDNEANNYSTTQMKRMKEELDESQKENETLKTKLKLTEKSRDDLKNEIKSLNENINTSNQENMSTIQKLKNQIKENEENIADLKNQNDELKDQIRVNQDKSKIQQYADQRNQSQLKEQSNTITNLNSSILKMKDKLNIKSEKIEELEAQLREASVKVQTLEDDNAKLAVDLNAAKAKINESKKIISKYNSGQLSSLQQENDKLRRSFTAITKQFESQSQELINLRKSLMSATKLLHLQVEVVSKYDRTCESLSDAKQSNYETTNKYNQLQSQFLQQNDRLNELDRIMKNIMGLTNCESPEDVPMQILKMKDFGCLENQRLISAFENQIRFMSNLVNSDILYSRNNISLNEDTTFSEKLKMEMIRLKKFIEENTVHRDAESNAEEDEEEFNIDTSNREDFLLLSTQVMRNEILRKYSERLKKDSQTLVEAAKAVEFEFENETDLASLPVFLKTKMKQIKDFIEEAGKHMNTQLNPENPYEDILDYIELTNNVFDDIKTNLNFDGNILEIPQKVETLARYSVPPTRSNLITQGNKEEEETIENFNNSSNFRNFNNRGAAKERSVTFDGDISEIQFKEQLSTMKSGFDAERDKMQETIDTQKKKLTESQNKVKGLSNDKKKLIERIQELSAHLNEYENREMQNNKTMAKLKSDNKELESQMSDLRTKNSNLHDEMDTKMKNADQRIENLLKQENLQHQNEIKNIQQRFNTMAERQNEVIEKKNQKIKTLKGRLNEVITTYESAFKKQKETIRQLREKTDQCVNKTEEVVAEKDESHLQNSIAILESEKGQLEAKVDQLEAQMKEVQANRDTFWKVQIAIVENNMKDKVENEVSNTLKKIASHAKCDPTVDAIVNVIDKREKRDFSQILSKSINNPENRSAMKQLDEWEKWSRQLFANVNHGEVFTHNSKELRFILGEMVLSSISHHQLISRLESLRQQKIIFILGKTCPRTSDDEPPEIRSLLIFASFLVRIKSLSGQLEPNSIQPR